MTTENDGPKIHIDSDWKEEAQKEKDRLAEQEATQQDQKQLGKPGILDLVNMIAMQATAALGGLRTPQGESIPPDPELARFHIDLLDVLDTATKGNLSDEESKTLAAVLHQLRTVFISMASAPAPSDPKKG